MFYRFGKITLIAAALAALLGTSPAVAADVIVGQAWSRATPKGAKVAGGYLTIQNRGIQPDRLLSASSGAAAKVEIHQMSLQDGIMTMRSLEDGLAIPPDATVTLAPGGDHIMFIGLVAPFEEGQRVPVSLNFARAGKIEASFEVGSVGAKGPRLQIASTEPAVAAAAPTRSGGRRTFHHPHLRNARDGQHHRIAGPQRSDRGSGADRRRRRKTSRRRCAFRDPVQSRQVDRSRYRNGRADGGR